MGYKQGRRTTQSVSTYHGTVFGTVWMSMIATVGIVML